MAADTVYRERILTVCRWGLVRSVALREILIREVGADAIAIGLEKNSDATIEMLCGWADIVVVATPHLLECRRASLLPPGKTVVLSLGADVWQAARHSELQQRAGEELAPLLAQIRRTRRCHKSHGGRSSRLPE